MPQIRPIKDLKNATEMSKICHESKEPIFITKNGYGDMVLMSIETYEKSIAKLELYQKLSEAERDLSEGNVLDAEDVFSKLREKHFGK